MRSIILLIGILSTFIGATATAQVTVPVNDQAALDFYKSSQLVISKATVNPFELAGCLVLHKDGQVDQYINVLPESIKKTLKPQNLTESVYRTMLTKEQAFKVGFLGALGISVSEKSLLEISISDRWRMESPSFWGDNELKKNVLDIGKIYASMGYKVAYNQSVQYSILSSSDYQENSANVTSTFTYVDAGGKRFVQSSNYSQRELISIAPFDITPVLAVWNPAVTSSAKFQISKSQIESLIGKSTVFNETAIKLDSADTNLLKMNAKHITSTEFKSNLFK